MSDNHFLDLCLQNYLPRYHKRFFIDVICRKPLPYYDPLYFIGHESKLFLNSETLIIQ